MSVVVKTVGSAVGRDYPDFSTLEANINNTTYPLAGTTVRAEGYNDSPFIENVNINASASNVDRIVLTAAPGEKHSGLRDTGVKIIPSTGKGVTFSVPNVDIEDLEVSQSGTNNNNYGVGTTSNVDGWGLRRNLIYGIRSHKSFQVAQGVNATHSGANGNILNNLVFDIDQKNTSPSQFVIGIKSLGGTEVMQNTAQNINGTPGAGGSGIRSEQTTQNNMSTDVGGPDYDGTPLTFDHNLSSDLTATGAGSLTSKLSSDQYISTVIGSENLHLKSGADAIGAGIDLGITPTGVEIDIDGWNRDSDTPTRAPWDMGAHEFDSGGGGGPTFTLPQVERHYPRGTSRGLCRGMA